MKSDDDFDLFLTQHLRQSREYLNDEGFTASVMAALPVKTAPSRRIESLVIGVPLFIISVLVFSQFPFASFVSNIWYWLIQMDVQGWLQIGFGVSACFLLAGVAWFFETSESL